MDYAARPRGFLCELKRRKRLPDSPRLIFSLLLLYGPVMDLLWVLSVSMVTVCVAIPMDAAGESHSLFTCEPITLRMCQGLPYNATYMPNILNHYDQQTAALAMEPFHPMVNLQCSPDLRMFLCALYAPVCTEYGRMTLPCRRLCLQARSDCYKLMDMFGVSWPQEMECTSVSNLHPPLTPSGSRTVTSRTPVPWTAVQLRLHRLPHLCPEGLWILVSQRTQNQPRAGLLLPGGPRLLPPLLQHVLYARGAGVRPLFHRVVSIVCLSATLFTFLTFLIDVSRFRYPERPIIFYAVCYMMVSLVFFLGFLLEDNVSCNAAIPGRFRAATVTQGSHNKACTLLFMVLYFFTMAGSVWWVILTITWFLAAVPKWGSEAIEKKALLFHACAWGIPGVLTVTLLAMNKIEGDSISGVCFVGLYNLTALRWFLIAPLGLDVVVGVALLLAGIAALNRVRIEIPLEKENQEKLVKFMIRIAVFSVLYLVPAGGPGLLPVREQLPEHLGDHLGPGAVSGLPHPLPLQVERTSRPDLALFLTKYVMMLIVGIPSVFWVGSKKTCFEWAGFFHGKRRKDRMVNDSRQVLKEPDFAQLLLRDPNTPIVRKSRGTSTQGTSTHASSTHLAMLDEPPSGSTSRAGSVRSTRSKMSSYHGSLHRNRDDRWVHRPQLPGGRRAPPLRQHAPPPRPPRHCSTTRLDSLSRHGSTQRLESQSRHSSVRDLTSTTQAVLGGPGNGIHRVLEEDGGTA
ncbi:hypothetical protein F7725_019275 [Dissostichus mawsoni]|uniref:Frizzled-3 n=1 Tax=Dissostichus mawsoni TaxID=36200 RepID=A0A7J5YJ82_DISMA|nr:hypothetical protein F7725_019275 [Dissostichus mawsoni]